MTPTYQARAKRRTSSTRGRTSHDDRTGDQEAARGSAQPPDTGGNGGAQAGGGDPNWFARNYNAMLSANNYFGQPHLYTQAHQNALAQNAITQQQFHYHIGITQQQLAGAQALGFYPGALILVPPTTPPAPLPTEIKAGEIVAWRCWRARADGSLSSMTQEGIVWSQTIGVFTPALHIIEAGQEDLDRGLGVHAWKTREQAEDYAKLYAENGEVVAIGTVELWGEVIEHDQGYRGQFGQIKEIVETRRPAPTSGNPYNASRAVVAVYAPDERATIDDNEGPVKVIAMCALIACALALLVFGFR